MARESSGFSLFDEAVINYTPGFANRLKAGFLVADFEHHKVVVVVKARCGEAASLVYVPAPDLPGGARNEILNALLRLDALVDVIVTGNRHVHSVTGKQGLETSPQTGGR